MQTIKKLILFSLMVVVAYAAMAQPHGSKHEERWEKYRAEKIAFLTSELELTPAEAQKFWPVYNQLEKERWKAQKFRREMEGKVLEAEESMSEAEIKQLTREFAGSLKKEANLLTEYNEKFLEILPPGKVLELYKTENEFRMHMIKKFRDKRRNGE
ncbi:hypothetical protein [Mariniphaga sediminis]|uniref:hypothetical protein n=1 Tax=Mariniphaga sediminis TaxID=1628158 RepID=UPI003563B1B5